MDTEVFTTANDSIPSHTPPVYPTMPRASSPTYDCNVAQGEMGPVSPSVASNGSRRTTRTSPEEVKEYVRALKPIGTIVRQILGVITVCVSFVSFLLVFLYKSPSEAMAMIQNNATMFVSAIRIIDA